MPKGKTKKFIDKKNSVTFHLVHRSQKDPLIADETAPQRVLVPAGETQATKLEKKPLDKKKRVEEQQKYGIYFDDDYDYLQHLKDVNTLDVEWVHVDPVNVNEDEKKKDCKLNLPSSVFASNVEEKVGLLNKAAPVSGLRLDIDPDIVAALDNDFDFDDPENELEDNFIELANAKCDDEEDLEDEEYEDEFSEEEDTDASSNGHMELSDEEKDELCSLNGPPQHSFKDEETKSRFTEYSMSSSVMRRNEQLALLDEKFDKLYSVYDDNEIGALDWDDIEGHIASDSSMVLQCAKEFEKLQKEDMENVAELMRERMKIIEQEYSSSDEDDLIKLFVDAREKDKWDCESIISTYSNIYNHPKLIVEQKAPRKIKIHSKTGIPKDVLDGSAGKLTSKALAQFNLQNKDTKSTDTRSVAETMKSTLSVLSVRPKDESPDERKTRKKALKEYRKERRIERKANKEAFKEEKKRQEKILLNTRQNIQGNRIL